MQNFFVTHQTARTVARLGTNVQVLPSHRSIKAWRTELFAVFADSPTAMQKSGAVQETSHNELTSKPLRFTPRRFDHVVPFHPRASVVLGWAPPADLVDEPTTMQSVVLTQLIPDNAK